MYYVYILKSVKHKYIYVGMSDNLNRRLREHNLGWNKTTKPYAPFNLLHSKGFEDRISSRAREKWFKTGEGRGFIKAHYLK
jgi:putative endonuclease